MKSDQKDAHVTAPAAANPYLHEEDHQVAHPAHAHDEMPAVAPHPTAMLAYVDHDHDHAAPAHPAHPAHPAKPEHLSPAVAKAIATAEAAMAHVNQVVHDEVAKEQKRHALQEQKDKITHSINGPAAIVVASQLAGLSHDMNDAKSRAFIQTLDTLQDPDLRHQVMEQFQAQTGQKMEDFINGSSDWANNGKNRDKAAALALISPERDQADKDMAAMSPADRKAAQDKAATDAKTLMNATTGRDHSDENSQKIFRILEKKTPAEMEMLRAAMRDESKGEFNLYERIDYGMHKGDEDEAVAMLAGDHVKSAQAALKNEDDPKRLVEAVNNLGDKDRAKMLADPTTAKLVTDVKNPADRAALNAALAGNKDLADGERLGNLMKPKEEGMGQTADNPTYDKIGMENYDRRKAKNVLREFEGMSGEQVHAAVVAWDKAHPDRTMESMLDARWGNDDDKTEYNRLKAMMAGDKGKDRSLRLEEGLKDNDKDEVEGALAHEKTDLNDLKSKDANTAKHAKAVKDENDSFERNNIEADHTRRMAVNLLTGRHDDATGHSTADRITAHTNEQEAKDVKQSYQECLLRADGQDKAADALHALDRAKHEKEERENGIAAQELLADGKLSHETEFHRGKGAKEKAAALEGISNNKQLAAAQKAYHDKYGEEMLPDPKKDRSDLNANELMIDNVRLYGARAERPAQVEAMLEVQQYEVQKSKSLEYDEGGRGTQEYQRILMEKQREMLKDPKFAVHAPKFVDEINGTKLPFPQMVEDPNEPTFEDTQAAIDKLQKDAGGDIHKVDDGLKAGVKKSDFNAVDKQLVAANAEQEGAKKRLAEKFVKIFSTIAKIAAVLTANPWLIALIDVGEGLIEMGIKHEVMGEAYDATEDLKMLAITGAADIALLGFSKLGEMKGAAKLAEAEAVSLGEKAALETEHAVTAEAKSEAVREGAHAAAGESSALRGAIEEGSSAEKALSKEAAGEVGAKVEQKAAEVAEGKAAHEGQSAAAKQAESELAQGTAKVGEEGAVDAAKAAEKIRANYALAGGAAKMGVQTVGGGVVQGKSASDMLKGLVTGGLGLVLPAGLAGKAKAAIGTETAAAKVLGEVASFGTEVMTNTTINAAGGAEGGDALFDATLGAGGARAQHLYAGPHAATPVAEEEHAPAREEAPVREETSVVRDEAPEIGRATEPEIGGASTSLQKGDTEHRVAANVPEVVGRANDKLANMDPANRARHEELFAQAENRGQQVLLERAIAAGRSYDELEMLRGAMSGKSEAQVLLEFSGSGIVQLYHQSCVPASYQIALSEVDPVAAWHYRNHPEEMMQKQRSALVAGDAAQTQRPDLDMPPSEHVKAHTEDPEMRAFLDNPERYDASGKRQMGMDPTDMKGHALHEQLEKATGTKYEVLGSDQYKWSEADGVFSSGGIPFERIGFALDAGKPVLFGANGHERVIIGREYDASGATRYIVTDPWNGGTKSMPASDFHGMKMENITLPAEAQMTGGPPPMPAEGSQAVVSGNPGSARSPSGYAETNAGTATEPRREAEVGGAKALPPVPAQVKAEIASGKVLADTEVAGVANDAIAEAKGKDPAALASGELATGVHARVDQYVEAETNKAVDQLRKDPGFATKSPREQEMLIEQTRHGIRLETRARVKEQLDAEIARAKIDAAAGTSRPDELAAAQRAEAALAHDPSLVRPSRDEDPTATPRGKPAATSPRDKDPVNIRAAARENDSANAVARGGYDIEQQPTVTGTSKNPDYRIEGQIFDNYAPTTSNPRSVWDTIRIKVEGGQTKRIILNLQDSNVSLEALRAELHTTRIDDLEQILVVRDGVVVPWWP